jgi:hypothetical protein
MPVTDQVRDAARDDTGFSGSGARENQQWSADMQDRFALFWVERV